MMNEREYRLKEKELEDYHNASRVAEWSPLSQLPFEKRLRYAKMFGENWASIMSGLGDQ